MVVVVILVVIRVIILIISGIIVVSLGSVVLIVVTAVGRIVIRAVCGRVVIPGIIIVVSGIITVSGIAISRIVVVSGIISVPLPCIALVVGISVVGVSCGRILVLRRGWENRFACRVVSRIGVCLLLRNGRRRVLIAGNGRIVVRICIVDVSAALVGVGVKRCQRVANLNRAVEILAPLFPFPGVFLDDLFV